ncbi:MAG TPA: TIR domain-containing protein [Reyranellaceae bacterium]|nr:TIR domain-containing protein [Reyranellaceae bacterium]
MARIFISHSSRDGEPASRLKSWLQAQGFDSVFLDFDKHLGIPPGADWERTLYREIARSHAVILLLTPDWHASKWCWSEFTQARALGKAIFPVIEAATGETFIAPDIQHLDLRRDRDGGLERLARALDEVARQQHDFPWDSARSPYPGLLAFQEEDAAIYFGRDDDVRGLIERLNARRTQGGANLVVLLGASGSGKSSLLRAGVLPRLRRDKGNWIVLPALRPQLQPLDEIAGLLAQAHGSAADWRAWRDRLAGPDARTVLLELARDLRQSAGKPEAQILIPIDQAEELFSVSDPAQAAAVLRLLDLALQDDMPFLGVMAMRSDSLDRLQRTEELAAPFEEFSLKPMPLQRIPEIVEGPARIAGITVEGALVVQLAADANTEDAMPLLAFALRELYEAYGRAKKALTLDDYLRLGDPQLGLTPLENAVRKSADQVLAVARAGDPELRALRSAFVPAMVRLNDKGEYVRRPANWRLLPAAAHPLLEKLAAARLLVLRQDGGERIVEVAHEALLRKWPLLRNWLDEEREFLIGKARLELALQEWQAAPAAAKPDALLTGLQLDRAAGWLGDHAEALSADERGYIEASLAHRTRTARAGRRLKGAIFASLGALLMFGALAGPPLYNGYIREREITREAMRTDLEGSIQAHATAQGSQAFDVAEGKQHSPYSGPMLAALRDPDLTVLQAIQGAHQDVTRLSGGVQRPYFSTSMNGQLYLWRQHPTRKRVALIISVDEVAHVRLLAPKKDADALMQLLRDAGFASPDVIQLHNPDRERFLQAAKDLCARLARPAKAGRYGHPDIVPAGLDPLKLAPPPAENALFFFYYSGVGVQVQGANKIMAFGKGEVKEVHHLDPIGIDLAELAKGIEKCAKASVLLIDTNFEPFDGNR